MAGTSQPIPAKEASAQDASSTTPTTVQPQQPAAPQSDSAMDAEASGTNAVSDILPSKKVLDEVKLIPVQDSEGKDHLLGNICEWPEEKGQKRRVLVIFIRHFFCGVGSNFLSSLAHPQSCQEYVKTLATSLGSPASLPARTKLVIIGCGAHSLIPMYTQETSCTFPTFTDPTARLYSLLGMTHTMSLGQSRDYIKRSMPSLVVGGISQALRRIWAGDALKGGDASQVGGDFLFEATEDDQYRTTTEVTWCHRMKTTRDHTAVPELKRVMGLESDE